MCLGVAGVLLAAGQIAEFWALGSRPSLPASVLVLHEGEDYLPCAATNLFPIQRDMNSAGGGQTLRPSACSAVKWPGVEAAGVMYGPRAAGWVSGKQQIGGEPSLRMCLHTTRMRTAAALCCARLTGPQGPQSPANLFSEPGTGGNDRVWRIFCQSWWSDVINKGRRAEWRRELSCRHWKAGGGGGGGAEVTTGEHQSGSLPPPSAAPCLVYTSPPTEPEATTLRRAFFLP